MNQKENAIVDELQRQGFKYPTIAKMTGLSIYKVKHYCRTHIIDESEIKKTGPHSPIIRLWGIPCRYKKKIRKEVIKKIMLQEEVS